MGQHLLMQDSSEGDCQKEAMLDFVLSWTLRVAADDFPLKMKQPILHEKCRKILSKLIFKSENAIKAADKVISVDVWKQWKRIDLHANIVLEIDNEKQFHLLVIENKAYSPTHDNQLQRYQEIVNQEYDSDSYLKEFKKHFVLITFLGEDETETRYQAILKDCENNTYWCLPILDLQPNCDQEDTESDIFNEFWLREWR